jgi:hypothetical protein
LQVTAELEELGSGSTVVGSEKVVRSEKLIDELEDGDNEDDGVLAGVAATVVVPTVVLGVTVGATTAGTAEARVEAGIQTDPPQVSPDPQQAEMFVSHCSCSESFATYQKRR